MADRGTRVCDELCGCEVPCPGGARCICGTTAATTTAGQHVTCSCGEHCSCNPCTCERSTARVGTGRGSCTCGVRCTCPTCAA
ncbi:hypothetical protein J5N97_024692 [Dioscorea zingiberensis]|uniref:Uncharacterized protein n=1 Tax=Dioscorea zingiberensis TaxID=325984 RepID=A0A9D5C7F7_9LILI|nr:hypothetical protein J5N97_024692 [Dioscorea zingiberensis]